MTAKPASPTRFTYRALPGWFSHRPPHPLVQQFWRSRHNASPALPRASLYVTDDDGMPLANVAVARCDDYRLRVALPNSAAVADLYWHYLMFVILGGKAVYRGCDQVGHTYVKFGTCMQDTRALHIRIKPALQRKAT